MNSSGLPCSSPSPVVGPPPGAGVGVAGPAAGGAGAGGGGGGAVKLKFCRYYAKDKTCFYGEECQFLHEEPGAAPAGPGPAAPPLGGLPLGIPPPAAAAGPGYSAHGASSGPAAAVVGPKKAELGAGGGGGGGGGGLDGPRLASECGGAAGGGLGWAGERCREGAAGGALFLVPDTARCCRKQITTAMLVPGDPGPYRWEGAGRCVWEGAPGQLSIRPSSARLGAGSQVLPARSQAGSRQAAFSGAVPSDGLFRTAFVESRLFKVLNVPVQIQR